MDKQITNFNQRLLVAMKEHAAQTCLKVKIGGRYQNASYRWFQVLTYHLVSYLRNRGLKPGDRVAIVAENSLEWLVSYIACILAGGIAVPLRFSIPAETLEFVLQDSGASIAILQSPEHVNMVNACLDLPNSPLSALNHVLLAIPDKTLPGDFLSVREVFLQTSAPSNTEQTTIETYAATLSSDKPVAINYVTSETGEPKGAVFDQANYLASMAHFEGWLTFTDDEMAFTARPWNEGPNLLLSLYYFIKGIPNALPERQDLVIESMRQVTPTITLTIPYGLEQFYESCLTQIREQSDTNQKMFQWALAKGKAFIDAGEEASADLRQEFLRADMTFFSQFRGQIGGRLHHLYATGATLPKDVAQFFQVLGVPVLNIYSLTEAGGFPAICHANDYRTAACGYAAPGYEVKISADNEVMVRSHTVMRGYWQRPEATQQSLTPDGWLYTGDEGYLDEDGYLHITGRKHHLMVLSTGRKVASRMIENYLVRSPFINQVAIFGEGKPYVSAMIVPDLATLEKYFTTQHSPNGDPVTTTGHPKVKELLDQVIWDVNQHLDKWEQVREYSLLEQPLSQDMGELTPSMRVSRHVVAERYADKLEAMYPDTLHLGPQQPTNQMQVDPERLRELLEKEILLDAWMSDAGIEFLFDLALEMQIDRPSLVNVCDTAASIAQMENEEKPLSTAIIVGEPAQIVKILPASQIQLHHHDHIRRMRKELVTLAKIVDGHVLGYVVDKYGYVRGVHKLEINLGNSHEHVLLGPQFHHHASISQRCQAMVFYIPAGGRQVRVFANGDLVGRYANGDWSPEKTAHIEDVVDRLARTKQYNKALISRILGCAFQMSENNWGAIFLMGQADLILRNSDTSEISSFATITSAPMASLSDDELITFAKQDGATVIDQIGEFRACMVLLRPAADTRAEIGPGKGARHSSAAKMSAEARCLSITVSQDGPITVYCDGRRVLSL